MGLSFRKRMNLSSRILAATEEALELHRKYNDLFTELDVVGNELSESTEKLLALHKELLNDAKIPDEIEVTDGSILQVVTNHGTYIVGSECPVHSKVHHLGGWYICVDGGMVNVHGWHPSIRSN